MPRDGALALSDVLSPTLSIVCERCGRRGRYALERLIGQHGADADAISDPQWRHPLQSFRGAQRAAANNAHRHCSPYL